MDLKGYIFKLIYDEEIENVHEQMIKRKKQYDEYKSIINTNRNARIMNADMVSVVDFIDVTTDDYLRGIIWDDIMRDYPTRHNAMGDLLIYYAKWRRREILDVVRKRCEGNPDYQHFFPEIPGN